MASGSRSRPANTAQQLTQQSKTFVPSLSVQDRRAAAHGSIAVLANLPSRHSVAQESGAERQRLFSVTDLRGHNLGSALALRGGRVPPLVLSEALARLHSGLCPAWGVVYLHMGTAVLSTEVLGSIGIIGII